MENVIGFLLASLVFGSAIFLFWVLPIWLGLRWAKIKGVSKLWMLFGIHPVTGWIAFLVLKYGIEPRKKCRKCKESIIINAQICRYCGNEMTEEEINYAINEFELRKNQ